MGSLEPLFIYKRGAGGFIQRFLINQNGVFKDLTLISGVLTVTWWFKVEEPGSIPRSIVWTGTIDGANSNRVSFAVPEAFFNVATDYDCDLEIKNDGTLTLPTKNQFIVRVEEFAGT